MLLKIITGVVVLLGLALHAGAPRAMALPMVSVDLPPPNGGGWRRDVFA